MNDEDYFSIVKSDMAKCNLKTIYEFQEIFLKECTYKHIYGDSNKNKTFEVVPIDSNDIDYVAYIYYDTYENLYNCWKKFKLLKAFL